MKLVRFGEFGTEKPGILLVNETIIDVSAFGEDYNEQFFATDGLKRLADWLLSNENTCPVIDGDVRLGACIARPSKIICIGLNYAKHAAESGVAIPKEPVVFFKATSAICGPNDSVIIPRNSLKTDWEVELAIVIGKRTSYIEANESMDHIAGFCLHNDYSEREFQLERGGQWVKGKSNDTFAPLGPFMATKDEVNDPQNLKMWLKVNGTVLQDSNTSDMIFDIKTIVSYLSNFMTLLPGDVISTGTPAGVGLGLKPPMYLKPGDIVELGVEGLGEQRQISVAWA